MKKRMLKSFTSLMLAIIMVFGCLSVMAEEAYTFINVSADTETTIKAWTDKYKMEMSNPERIASGKDSNGINQTVIGIKLGQYVVFRANVLETGMYDIATIFGIANESKQKFNIYVDDQDAVAVAPIYSGKGTFDPEAINVLSVPLTKGQHTIKVESAGANGYLIGIKLTCTAKEMQFVDAKANGESFIEYPYVNVNAKSLELEFTEELADVTVDDVTLTAGEESLDINPSASGKVLSIGLNEALEQSKTYTLALLNIKDKSGLTTISDVSYTFVAYDGNFSTTKYPDIVIEAENFVEAGVYSGGYVKDESLVEVKTEGDVTYVEFDNMEYVKIPYEIPAKAYYSIHVVYATDCASMQMSVLSQYQKRFPKTADLDTFSTFDPSYSSVLNKGNLVGYLRPQVFAGEKCRIDKVILKRGTVVPSNGDVSVRKMITERDGQSDNYDEKNSILYSGSWIEFVYNFSDSGYYNLQCSAKTPVNNAMNFIITIDNEEVNTVYRIVKKATSGEADTNPLDLGTYYFEKGSHIVRIANTRPNGANMYNLLVQKTDTVNGIIAYAEGSLDYAETVSPDLVTEVKGGEYVTISAEVKEAGYYGVFAMLSNANGEAANYTLTVDDSKVYEAKAIATTSLRITKQQKVSDVYLTEGTHTFKFAAIEEGKTIGVNTLRLYKAMVEYDGLAEGENVAKVKLNGLFAEEEASAAMAIYKEKDGVKQLCAVDYVNVAKALSGDVLDLDLEGVEAEDGFTYSAKIFVWSNMAGEEYIY